MRYLLALFAISLPFSAVSRAFIGLGSGSEILLLAICLLSLSPPYSPKLSVPMNGRILLLLLFAGLTVVSWLWDGGNLNIASMRAHVTDAMRPIEYCAGFFVLRHQLRNPILLRWFGKGLWTGCIIAACFSIVHWLMGPTAGIFFMWGPEWAELYTEESLRVYGSFGNPLNLVAYIGTFFGMSLSLSQRRVRWVSQVPLMVVQFILLFALAVSGSKVAVLVLVVAVLLNLRSFNSMAIRSSMRNSWAGHLNPSRRRRSNAAVSGTENGSCVCE